MDKILKTMFDDLRAELRKDLCADITTLLASKRRPVTGAASTAAAVPVNTEASMEDLLCQAYDDLSKEKRQMLRAKYIPKQVGLLSKEQKIMIMKQCTVVKSGAPSAAVSGGDFPVTPSAPSTEAAPDASDHTRAKVEPSAAEEEGDVEVIPLTESEEGEEGEADEAKEKISPPNSDGFYLQCSQIPIDLGTQVQPPPIESGGWRKRKLPTSSKQPPATPCSKRAAEPEKEEKDQTDEPPTKKQATNFIQIDWNKILCK